MHDGTCLVNFLEPYAFWEKLIHFWFCTKNPFESLILVGYDPHFF